MRKPKGNTNKLPISDEILARLNIEERWSARTIVEYLQKEYNHKVSAGTVLSRIKQYVKSIEE